MKKLILVAGPPACGKTYVSNLISKNLGNITYLDKDDLAPLVRRTFKLNNENFNMDGEFYSSNVRDVEYETLINIALSSLSYSDIVLINAPLSQEVRDIDYMKSLKSKAQLKGAKLIVIWVTIPIEICYKRMQERNAERDALKLKDFYSYAKNINYSAPTNLTSENAVDNLIVFDNSDETATNNSLKTTLDVIKGEI